MHVSTAFLAMTAMAIGTFANAIDNNALLGLGEGVTIAGIVIRDVNGVERMVDYNKAVHLMARQDFCAIETIYSCGAPAPTPIVSATPGGPISSVTSPAGSVTTEAPTAAPGETTAAGTVPSAPGSSAAPSAPASSTSAAAATSAATTRAPGSTEVSATESIASPTIAGTTTAVTSSALPTDNAADFVDTNVAAAMILGLAVAAFV